MNKKLSNSHTKSRSRQPFHSKTSQKLGLSAKLKLLPPICNMIHGDFTEQQYASMFKSWMRFVDSSLKNHGIVEGPKKYKSIRTYVFSMVEGRNPEPLSFVSTGRKDRIPSVLKHFRPLIKQASSGCKNAYKALNTILYSTRILERVGPGDFSSITEGIEHVDQSLLEKYRAYVRKHLRQREPISEFEVRLPLDTGAKGPNRKKKLDSALMEAVALKRSPLWDPFKELCDHMGKGHYAEYVKELEECPMALTGLETTQLRLVALVPDSDLKTRTVAICDYWTQLILEGFTPHIKGALKRLFRDSTSFWDHVNGFKMGASHPLAKNIMSYDLDSWTDRFHADFQKVLMEEMFGPKIADAWYRLVVKCQWYSPHLSKHITYKQGQGMGTTGSFLIATLADHFLIEMTMKDAYPEFKPTWYNKVGDDLWIVDPLGVIPKMYHDIGSVINLNKSKVPTEKGSFLEYVSRVAWDGSDVSRISPRIINRANDWRYVPVLLSVCHSTGLNIPAERLSTLNRVTKDGREYKALLSDLLTTLYWSKDDTQLKYLSIDWGQIIAQGYLSRGILKHDDESERLRYRLVRSVMIWHNRFKASNKTLDILKSTLKPVIAETPLPRPTEPTSTSPTPLTAEDRNDILRVFITSEDSREPDFFTEAHEAMLLNVNSGVHDLAVRLEGIMRLKHPSGRFIIHPKSLIALKAYWTDSINQAKAQKDIMAAQLNAKGFETSSIEEMDPFVFKDFKSLKDHKAVTHIIHENLRVFRFYDPTTKILSPENPLVPYFKRFLARHGITVPDHVTRKD